MLQSVYTKGQFLKRKILYKDVEREKTKREFGERKMGYALFTARKLALTARVNNLNSQLMQLQNQKTQLTNQIANNQNMANLQAATQQQQLASIFSTNIQSGMDYSQALVNYQNSMAQISLTSTQNNMSITALQSQDNVLDTQIGQLQTQLNATSQELESVKKAEESSIKNSTVKYVG